MDQLTSAERAEVEVYLSTYPELRTDLAEIERSLEFYAQATSLTPPPGLKKRVMDSVKDDFIPDSKSEKGGPWRMLSLLLGLGLVVVAYLFMQRGHELHNTQQAFAAFQDTCKTEQQKLNDRLQLLQQLTLPQNKIIPFTATPSYTTTTDIYLHHNATTKRNFIQVRNLPPLTADQTFELWSIKTGKAPARMDLFGSPANGLVEVQYVEGTDVYAITIEKAGGVDSPTMTNLIGTVAVGGQ
jgi:hypothetical protein